MKKVNYWEKLKSLPCEVIKKEGRFIGNYTFRLSVDDGVYFIEYVYNGWLFSEEEPVWPNRWSGNSLEEVVDKAMKFFEDNFGKYECVKY